MPRLAAALFTICLGLQPASAEAVFFHQQGNWTVASGQNACLASNRPSVEMNISPVAAVHFTQTIESPALVLDAFFWPGAFTKGQKTTLTLVKTGDAEVTLPATPVSDYQVTADRPFSRQEVRVLREQSLFAVKSPDVQFALGVDASGFEQAVILLGLCTSMLKRAQ